MQGFTRTISDLEDHIEDNSKSIGLKRDTVVRLQDEVKYLENRWLAFEPDLVVLVFYLNDAYDDGRFAQLIMGGERGQLQRPSESPSRLWALVETRHARWRAGRRC